MKHLHKNKHIYKRNGANKYQKRKHLKKIEEKTYLHKLNKI